MQEKPRNRDVLVLVHFTSNQLGTLLVWTEMGRDRWHLPRPEPRMALGPFQRGTRGGQHTSSLAAAVAPAAAGPYSKKIFPVLAAGFLLPGRAFLGTQITSTTQNQRL